MNFIVKKALSLTLEEKTARGLTGIPGSWPIESYPHTGDVPTDFELMSSEDLQNLKDGYQTEYNNWASAINPPLTGVLYSKADLKYKVQGYTTSGYLSTVTWFKTKTNDVYSNKAKEITYNFNENVLISSTEKTFDQAGNEYTSKTSTILTEVTSTTQKIIEEN